jgi:hypothetical protein
VNRRVLGIVAAAVAAAALLLWLLLRSPSSPPPPADITPVQEMATPTPAPEQRVVLLFGGSDGLLHPELRSVPLPVELEARIRIVLDQLLAGPDSGLAPTIPYPAEVQAVFLDGLGNAWVDLTPPPTPLAGSSTEILLTYGVVNTVLLNCPELHAVQLLFGGTEVATLTGHLDLSRPLTLNKGFIAS